MLHAPFLCHLLYVWWSGSLNRHRTLQTGLSCGVGRSIMWCRQNMWCRPIMWCALDTACHMPFKSQGCELPEIVALGLFPVRVAPIRSSPELAAPLEAASDQVKNNKVVALAAVRMVRLCPLRDLSALPCASHRTLPWTPNTLLPCQSDVSACFNAFMPVP